MSLLFPADTYTRAAFAEFTLVCEEAALRLAYEANKPGILRGGEARIHPFQASFFKAMGASMSLP